MDRKYADFAIDKTVSLLAVDSPTGYTSKVAAMIKDEFSDLGCEAFITNKGGIAAVVSEGDANDTLLIEAHADTLGGVVCDITSEGRLKISPLGGLKAANCEAHNCRIITLDEQVYTGTIQLHNPSSHVNTEYADTARNFDTVEVIIDEDVKNRDDVLSLGITNGAFVCPDPCTVVTTSGYIKSRFLDDKLSVGIILALAKYIKENGVKTKRRIAVHITVYEEVGHGAAACPFEGVTEALSVDMGCVGDGIECTEKQVSICSKDSGGPYNFDMVKRLVAAAKKTGADYAVDVYPRYGSDAEATLRAGYDIRHGLIGAGVFASHGYERSHAEGAFNTLKLLSDFIE